MEFFVLTFTYVCLIIAVGMFAYIRRNRSAFGWVVLSLLISPFFAFLFCAILRERATTAAVPSLGRFLNAERNYGLNTLTSQ
jgi:hypothetical protein